MITTPQQEPTGAREAFEARSPGAFHWKRGGSAFAEDVPAEQYADPGVQAHWELWRDAWITAIAASGEAARVPEPTEAMLVAGLKECEPLGELIDWREGFGRDDMRSTFNAMLAAAPKAPASAEVGSDDDVEVLGRIASAFERIASGMTTTASEKLYDSSVRPRKMTIRDAVGIAEVFAPIARTLMHKINMYGAAAADKQAPSGGAAVAEYTKEWGIKWLSMQPYELPTGGELVDSAGNAYYRVESPAGMVCLRSERLTAYGTKFYLRIPIHQPTQEAPEAASPSPAEGDAEALAQALEFYSDPADYKAPFTGGMGALYFDCGAKARDALAAHRAASKVQPKGTTAERLLAQVRETCAASLRAGPGVAVTLPAELAEEGRKFMRGEASLIEQLPFADVQKLGDVLNEAPTTQAPAPAPDPSPTAGMTLAQRILHVGGRNNAAGYVEFGSTQAVEALIRQVLRDSPSPAVAPTQETPQAEVLTDEQIDSLAGQWAYTAHPSRCFLGNGEEQLFWKIDAHRLRLMVRAALSASRTSAATSEQREGLAANIMRFGGLTKHQARALIAFSLEGTEPEPGLFDGLPSASPDVTGPWQPIETAPKNGRPLLLGYFNEAGKWRTVRGEWLSADYIAENWEDPDMGEPGWHETPVEAEDPPNCWPISPSHWMPLPAAPTAKQEVDHD